MISVTLSATHGLLTLDGVVGLDFTTGDGTGDALLVFSGEVTDVNAALDGLEYHPDADFTGIGVISIAVEYGGRTINKSINVTVLPQAADNAAVFDLPVGLWTPEEVPLAIEADINDEDEPATFEIQIGVPTNSYTAGTLSLGTTTGLTFSLGDGTDDAQMQFSGSASDVKAALANISFTSAVGVTGEVVVRFTNITLTENVISDCFVDVRSDARFRMVLNASDTIGHWQVLFWNSTNYSATQAITTGSASVSANDLQTLFTSGLGFPGILVTKEAADTFVLRYHGTTFGGREITHEPDIYPVLSMPANSDESTDHLVGEYTPYQPLVDGVYEVDIVNVPVSGTSRNTVMLYTSGSPGPDRFYLSNDNHQMMLYRASNLWGTITEYAGVAKGDYVSVVANDDVNSLFYFEVLGVTVSGDVFVLDVDPIYTQGSHPSVLGAQYYSVQVDRGSKWNLTYTDDESITYTTDPFRGLVDPKILKHSMFNHFQTEWNSANVSLSTETYTITNNNLLNAPNLSVNKFEPSCITSSTSSPSKSYTAADPGTSASIIVTINGNATNGTFKLAMGGNVSGTLSIGVGIEDIKTALALVVGASLGVLVTTSDFTTIGSPTTPIVPGGPVEISFTGDAVKNRAYTDPITINSDTMIENEYATPAPTALTWTNGTNPVPAYMLIGGSEGEQFWASLIDSSGSYGYLGPRIRTGQDASTIKTNLESNLGGTYDVTWPNAWTVKISIVAQGLNTITASTDVYGRNGVATDIAASENVPGVDHVDEANAYFTITRPNPAHVAFFRIDAVEFTFTEIVGFDQVHDNPAVLDSALWAAGWDGTTETTVIGANELRVTLPNGVDYTNVALIDDVNGIALDATVTTLDTGGN